MKEDLVKYLENNGIRVDRGFIALSDRQKALALVSQFVTAQPRIVPSTNFKLDVAVNNLEEYQRLMSKNKTHLFDYNGYEVYVTGGYAFAIDPDPDAIFKLVYLIKLQNYTVAKKKAITQVVLWRYWVKKQLSGISTKVFWEYVTTLAPLVASDREQTENGMRFWLDIANEAESRGYNLYISDRNKGLNEKVEYSDVVKRKDEIWGLGGKHEYIRLVITKDKEEL